MKKFLLIFLLFCFISAGCSKKEAPSDTYDKILKRGYVIAGIREDAGVFGRVNKQGENEGFDIDLAGYIAEKFTGSKKNIKFKVLTPAERIEAASSGEADIVIAALSDTLSRRDLIDFSIPYYTAGQTAAVKKDSRIYNFSDLKDKVIIVVLGAASEQNIRRIMPAAKIVGYKSYKEAFDALKKGKGDAVSTDDTILAGFLAENKGYRMLKNRISAEYYSIGIQKTEDKILKKRLDAVIEEAKQNGYLKSLKEKWKLN